MSYASPRSIALPLCALALSSLVCSGSAYAQTQEPAGSADAGVVVPSPAPAAALAFADPAPNTDDPVDPLKVHATKLETTPQAEIEPVSAAEAAEEATKEAEVPPAISVNAWLNATTRLQSFQNPEKLNKVTQDAVMYLLFTGQITKRLEVSANVFATFGPKSNGSIAGTASILDLNARLNLADEFHVWIGRMLVPSDRANFSGPWFIAPQHYPGFFDSRGLGIPAGPRQGPQGRNDGATVWGQFGGGRFKYFVGAFDLYQATQKTLYSGRLNLALLDKEPGFFHSSTYYGAKDVLSIGLGGQYQRDGAGLPGGTKDDYALANGDVLFEKNLGKYGVIDLEGSFYKYMGRGTPDYSYFALASWLTPKPLGYGKLQPLVRVQQLMPRGDGAQMSTVIEGQLGYVVREHAARFNVGYQRSKIGGADGNAMYLGVQLLK